MKNNFSESLRSSEKSAGAGALARLSLSGLACVDGESERHRITRLGGSTIPPFPDNSVIEPAKAPEPSFIRSDFTEIDRAVELASAYRGMCAHVFQCPSVYLLRGSPDLHKDFSMLTAFAGVLERDQVQPAVWTLFSFRAWQEQGPGHAKPPSAKWCFAVKRFDSQRAYFEEMRANLVRDFLPPLPSHVELAEEHREMWRALLAEQPRDIETVREIVARHFPGMTYEARVRVVQAETRAAEARANRQALNGSVLWTA